MFVDRRFQWFLFTIALSLSLASLYFELVVGLAPCPLCIMQRVAVFFLTFLLLFKLLFTNKKLRGVFSALALLVSFTGLFFASRQVYLQSLPSDKVPACGPSLEILMKYFPAQDVMHALFYGTGNCAKVDWTFLGASMAFWSMLVFVGFVIALLGEAYSRFKLS
jgi:disulfide bond formation protein DsbB